MEWKNVVVAQNLTLEANIILLLKTLTFVDSSHINKRLTKLTVRAPLILGGRATCCQQSV